MNDPRYFANMLRSTSSIYKLGVGTILNPYRLVWEFANLSSKTYGYADAFSSWNTSGWDLVVQCPRRPEYLEYVPAPPGAVCADLQSANVEADVYALPTQSSAMNGVVFWEYTGCPFAMPPDHDACLPAFVRRYSNALIYSRQNPGLPNIPSPRHYPVHPVMPLVNPNIDPNALPISNFVPLFRPVPMHLLRTANRIKQRIVRNSSPTRRDPYFIQPQVVPIPGTVPWGVPHSQVTTITPGVQTVTNSKPYFRKPPGKRVKERKFVLGLDRMSPLGIAVNVITESADVIEALYFAIPPRLRGRAKTPQARLEAIYRNFLHIDVSTALKNLLVNEIGDRIVGRVGRQAAKFNRKFNMNLQLGPAL